MSALEETLALQLRASRIPFEREYKFHPERRWRFDFAIPEKRIAIECEGGTWLKKGGHTTGSGYAKNCEKYNAAIESGWLVLRYTGDMIKSGKALAQIERVLGMDTPNKLRRAGAL